MDDRAITDAEDAAMFRWVLERMPHVLLQAAWSSKMACAVEPQDDVREVMRAAMQDPEAR